MMEFINCNRVSKKPLTGTLGKELAFGEKEALPESVTTFDASTA